MNTKEKLEGLVTMIVTGEITSLVSVVDVLESTIEEIEDESKAED